MGRSGYSPVRTMGGQLASRKTRKMVGLGGTKKRDAMLDLSALDLWVLVKATLMWKIMRACVAEREREGDECE